MSLLARHSLTIIWLVLLLATGLSWSLGHAVGWGRPGNAAIIMIAAIKIRLVLHEFMELRTAPLAWRLAFDIWLVILTAALIMLCLVRFS